MTRPVMLVVLDGFGIGTGDAGDATAQAFAPFFERARKQYPMARIETSGEAVGLPAGQMGNSEVGHMTLGAGRIVEQDMTRINHALAAGALDTNPALNEGLRALEQSGGTLHLMGLVSDGGVHSHIDQLVAILDWLRGRGIRPAVHAFLDGRDTPPRSGVEYLRALLPHVEAADGHIATVIGRYYAMDRDNRWERIRAAYDAIVMREGVAAPDAITAVRNSYASGVTDEFVKPMPIAGGAALRDGDLVLHFNFRADRARELTNAITGVCPDRYAGRFEAAQRPKLAGFVCLTEYDADFPLAVAFPVERPQRLLGELISEAGLRQLRIAETEKYAHVTFFFNGGEEIPFAGEDRVLIPSPRDVPTYDHKPEMSALELTDQLLSRIETGRYDFILVNYANPDMVGHTGILPAAQKAVETVDSCLEKICAAILACGGTALITADHGNCECMLDPATGEPHTAHTTNPVPLWWVTANPGDRRLRDGGLADLAPTVLELMGLAIPAEMTGTSLLARAPR